jgi:hypothetical protein
MSCENRHAAIRSASGSRDAYFPIWTLTEQPASGTSPPRSALHADAARTAAPNSGGHAPSWATQASAQPPMVVGPVAMVFRVTNEPWWASEESLPIEGPGR